MPAVEAQGCVAGAEAEESLWGCRDPIPWPMGDEEREGDDHLGDPGRSLLTPTLAGYHP